MDQSADSYQELERGGQAALSHSLVDYISTLYPVGFVSRDTIDMQAMGAILLLLG